MEIRDVLDNLKNYIHNNLGSYNLNDKALIYYTNQALIDLYTKLFITYDEALIVVPDNETKVFTLSTDDLGINSNRSCYDVNVILRFLGQLQEAQLILNNFPDNNKYLDKIKNKLGVF